MKQTIFSKGKGWYISATNYKDQNDKAYINLYFPKNTEPMYQDNGRGFSVKTIDIEEAKFTSYQGKPGMTIFKFSEVEKEPVQAITREQTNNGGGYAEIKSDDLPFY